MKYLVVIALLLSACHRAPQQVRSVPGPDPDPMEKLCLVNDYSKHTDQEFADCKAWLHARVSKWRTGIGPVPFQTTNTPTPPIPPRSTTYTIMKPNGGVQFLSCDGTTCMTIP